jgi:hypothetical protein
MTARDLKVFMIVKETASEGGRGRGYGDLNAFVLNGDGEGGYGDLNAVMLGT